MLAVSHYALPEDPLHLAAQTPRYACAPFVGRHKMYLDFIQPYFFKKEINELYQALINESLPLKFFDNPVPYLRLFGFLFPMVHTYPAYYPIIVKNTKRQRLLVVQLLQ